MSSESLPPVERFEAQSEAGYGEGVQHIICHGGPMEKLAKYLLTLLICLVAGGQFVQVLTRYVFEIPVMGLEETLLFPTIWLFIFGAVNASREDTQVRANVLEIFLSSRRAHAVQMALAEVISIVIGLWLLYWAWDFTEYSWRVWKETPTIYLPTFYADASLFFGMCLMMIYTAMHLVKHIRIIIKPEAN